MKNFFLLNLFLTMNIFSQMPKDAKIYVAGHRGLVGSAICKCLEKNGYNNLLLKTHQDLDLEDEKQVDNFFLENKPEYVFLSAAKVGGILANDTYPVDFLIKNLKIESNIISCAHKYGVKKLLFLGSSCIYPKLCPQPIKEEYLLTGSLEPTNDCYALAKIAGIKMCQAYNKQYGANFISCMPTNLYGINDNFSPINSHVIPGLMRRIHEAKVNNLPEVIIWGTGKPRREFLFSDDLAEALLLLMNEYNSSEIINIGCGYDVTIRELAETISEVIGYKGKLIFDSSKPDGTPRKVLDVSKLRNLGCYPKKDLKSGLKVSYEWFKENIVS